MNSPGKTVEVMVAVMPGSSLEHITRLARREVSQLHHNDVVILEVQMKSAQMNPNWSRNT